MRSAAVLGLMTAVLFPLPSQGCGKSTAPEAVVQAQVEAYNAHDIERFVQCYADDITIHDLSGKTPPVKGHRGAGRAINSWPSPLEEFRVQILKRVSKWTHCRRRRARTRIAQRPGNARSRSHLRSA